MVNYKYFKSFKKKKNCLVLGLDSYFIAYHWVWILVIFFLVLQFWTLNFYINAGLWQSPLGIFDNFFLVLAQITLTFYSHCLLYYNICTLKKFFFF